MKIFLISFSQKNQKALEQDQDTYIRVEELQELNSQPLKISYPEVRDLTGKQWGSETLSGDIGMKTMIVEPHLTADYLLNLVPEMPIWCHAPPPSFSCSLDVKKNKKQNSDHICCLGAGFFHLGRYFKHFS